MHDATQAKNDYDQAVVQAETALAQAAAAGQYSTHVLIAGVGADDDASIPAVTTSVFGACTFAEWMLTRFQPRIGSVGPGRDGVVAVRGPLPSDTRRRGCFDAGPDGG